MRKKISCIVPECSFKTNGEKSIFKLPKNIVRLKLWLLACSREDLVVNEPDIHNNYGICEQHFEPKYVSKTNNTQKILLSNAHPTIFPTIKHKICDKKASIETPAKMFVASDKTPNNKNVECIDLTEEAEFKTHAKKVKPTTIKLKPRFSFQTSSGTRQIPSKRPIILRKTLKPKTDLSKIYLCNPSSNQASTSILKPVSSNSPLWATNQVNAKPSGLVGIVPTNKPNTILCLTPHSTRVSNATLKSKPFIYFTPVNSQPNTPDLELPIAVSTPPEKQTETTAKTYIATAHDILNVQDKNAEVFVLEKPNFQHDSSNEKTDSTELMEVTEISSCQNKVMDKESENKNVDDGIIQNNKTTVYTPKKEAGLNSAGNFQVQVQDGFNSKNDATNTVVETLGADNVNPFTIRIKSIETLSAKNVCVKTGNQNNNLNRSKKVSTQEKIQIQKTAKSYIAAHNKPNVQDKNAKVIKKINSTELKEIMETSDSQDKTINKEIENKHKNDVKILNRTVFTHGKEAGDDFASNNIQVQIQDDFISKNDSTNKVVETLNPDNMNLFSLKIKNIGMLSSKIDSIIKGIQNNKEIESQESVLQTVFQKMSDRNIDKIKSSPIVFNDCGRVTQRTEPLTHRHQSYTNQMFCTFAGCTTQRVDANSNFHHFPDEINSAIHWLVICKRPDILFKTRPEIKKFCELSVGVCSIHKEVIDKQINEDQSRYQDCPWSKPLPPPSWENMQKETTPTVAEEEIDLYDAYVPTKDYCAILSCSTSASDPIKKYKFPSDPDLLAAWTKTAGIYVKLPEEQYRTFFVCRKHFDDSQFSELGTLILTSVPHPHTEFVDPKANEKNAHWVKKKEKTTGLAKKPSKTIEKVSPPKKNVCVIKHCGSVGPTNRLYNFPDPVKEQLKFLNWARAVENKKTLTLQLMEKYAGAEICIKHFEKKYQIGGLFIKDNAIPSLDLFEVVPKEKPNTEQYPNVVPEFLEAYKFPPKPPQNITVEPEALVSYHIPPKPPQKIIHESLVSYHIPPKPPQNIIVEPEALMSYHMTPEEENASSPVWKTCESNVDPKSEPSRETLIRGNAKLYRNGIEFLNIKRALKYGKNCPKIEPLNFPYKVERSKKCIRYGNQNLDHGFRMQIHTAVIIDDDDESEKEAIAAITSVITKNASIIPKRPPRKKYGKSKIL